MEPSTQPDHLTIVRWLTNCQSKLGMSGRITVGSAIYTFAAESLGDFGVFWKKGIYKTTNSETHCYANFIFDFKFQKLMEQLPKEAPLTPRLMRYWAESLVPADHYKALLFRYENDQIVLDARSKKEFYLGYGSCKVELDLQSGQCFTTSDGYADASELLNYSGKEEDSFFLI